MIYRVFNIDYCIEPDDVGLNEEDYAMRSDYLRDCENEIEIILEELPAEYFFEIDEKDYKRKLDIYDIEEILSNRISDESGWLVYDYEYEKVEGVA